MSQSSRLPLPVPQAGALLLALGSAFALGSAWYFQLVLRLAPCPLCLDQRLAYYVGVPLGLLAFILLRQGLGGLGRALLVLLMVIMAANAVLAAYHAGVEWRFWPGPTSCTGTALPQITTSVLDALKTASVPRCDEAPWRLLGLSMAGWNVLIAVGLAGIAALSAFWPRKA